MHGTMLIVSFQDEYTFARDQKVKNKNLTFLSENKKKN
jgi:hypothetical protein